MKLDSEECKRLLEKHPIDEFDPRKTICNALVMTKMSKLALAVLSTKDEDVVNIPGITDMTDDEIDELASEIMRIRDVLGIED